MTTSLASTRPTAASVRTGPALRFSEVRKRFGRQEALRGLSLEVPRGSLFGLVGPNGAGKTTAFSIACGFLRPDAGEVALLGQRGADPAALKGRIGAMPQDAALGRETRCLEHLIFFGRLQGLSPRRARQEAERRLDELGLADRRHEKTKTLSHGMLRRLAVAQALLGDPELVLLDEPTSGLDPRHAADLRAILARSRGVSTIVVSSHNLPELETLCDHVAFIDRGAVLTAGPTDVVTGRGQEIEIELGEGPVPLGALTALFPGAPSGGDGAALEAGAHDSVRWDAERCVLHIVFRAQEGRAAEEIIGLALRALLDGGARISGVRRGTSLEKKFLAMT